MHIEPSSELLPAHFILALAEKCPLYPLVKATVVHCRYRGSGSIDHFYIRKRIEIGQLGKLSEGINHLRDSSAPKLPFDPCDRGLTRRRQTRSSGSLLQRQNYASDSVS